MLLLFIRHSSSLSFSTCSSICLFITLSFYIQFYSISISYSQSIIYSFILYISFFLSLSLSYQATERLQAAMQSNAELQSTLTALQNERRHIAEERDAAQRAHKEAVAAAQEV